MNLLKMLKLALMAITSSLVCLNGNPIPNPSTCTEPDSGTLQKRFKNINKGLDYRTLLFTSGWTKETLEDKFEDLVYLGLENVQAACPSTFLKGDFPLMLRSACPWFLIKHNDENRYPKQLYEADTKCEKCINSNGVQKCERVYQQIKTLKRLNNCSDDGVYQYEEQTTPITVAFTCAHQREVENSATVAAPPAEEGPVPM